MATCGNGARVGVTFTLQAALQIQRVLAAAVAAAPGGPKPMAADPQCVFTSQPVLERATWGSAV